MMETLYCHLGLLDYRAAHQLQRDLVEQRRRGELARDLFLITEHPAVFTLGRRGNREHLLVSEDFLADSGIPLVHIERGGDITYHGQGQLVIYPILKLRQSQLSAAAYVFLLEELMLRLARDWGVPAVRDPRNRGVWCNGRKLGSVGIAIRHGVAFHGLALNVNPALEPFRWIRPCGLAAVEMTSLAVENGRKISMAGILTQLGKHLAEVFDRNFCEIAAAQILPAAP
jgi:lipoyl(octanoyl) transferase